MELKCYLMTDMQILELVSCLRGRIIERLELCASQPYLCILCLAQEPIVEDNDRTWPQ